MDDMSCQILQLRLRRIEQLNEKLTDAFKKERIPASQAATLIIESTQETRDPLIPSIWQDSSRSTKFHKHQLERNIRPDKECCSIQ